MAIKINSNKQIKEKYFYKIIVVIVAIIAVSFILNVAPNYIRDELADKVNLIINNNNVTKKLKNDVIVRDKIVYISQDDLKNFFDDEIYYDSTYNHIVTTSNTKVAVLPINESKITINDANVTIYAKTIEEKQKYYIPFSEISKSVYNVETKLIEDSNIVIATSLDRELVTANSNKNNNVKSKPNVFSRNVDKIKTGDIITIANGKSDNSDSASSSEEIDNQGKWTKVVTANGKIGYVKSNTLANKKAIREDLEIEKQIEGNVSLVWDYFSEYKKAPQRTEKIQGINVVSPSFTTLKKQGKGEIDINIDTEGIAYIKWAHNNGYKVWTLLSNNSLKDTTSEILNDYKLRKTLIDNIIQVVEKYNIDGVNLDFENIYEKDKDSYTKLVIELAPKLRDINKVLSVDVTAPDGAPDWSLCFDREKIAKASDYIIFMAYDQYGASSKAGTTAGYDWVLSSLNKFLDINREGIDSKKVILAVPFYTRLWKINGENVSSEVVYMKNTSSKIPSDVESKWDFDLHQNYVEYVQKGYTYKMWIEDIQSLTEKLKLIKSKNLAGAAYWEKDMEDSRIWSVIESLVLK